uniref:Peroxidase-like protein n=1 Tax=Oryza sativa subsp. japonica TaxID=39947 RepID=Q6Z119_ORYSJ|nr:peroxidase-like protein [Oryza sativa Japonica Group]
MFRTRFDRPRPAAPPWSRSPPPPASSCSGRRPAAPCAAPIPSASAELVPARRRGLLGFLEVYGAGDQTHHRVCTGKYDEQCSSSKSENNFNSDWQLLTQDEARGHVREYADNAALWDHDFAASLLKLSKLPMPVGSKGEIRNKCGAINHSKS